MDTWVRRLLPGKAHRTCLLIALVLVVCSVYVARLEAVTDTSCWDKVEVASDPGHVLMSPDEHKSVTYVFNAEDCPQDTHIERLSGQFLSPLYEELTNEKVMSTSIDIPAYSTTTWEDYTWLPPDVAAIAKRRDHKFVILRERFECVSSSGTFMLQCDLAIFIRGLLVSADYEANYETLGRLCELETALYKSWWFDGIYYILIKEPNKIRWCELEDSWDNFMVEVWFQQETAPLGGEYALLFRKTENNYYALRVNPDCRTIKLSKKIGGEWTTIVPWRGCPGLAETIVPGSTAGVALYAERDVFHVFVGESYVLSARDGSLTEGRIAVGGVSGEEVDHWVVAGIEHVFIWEIDPD